MLEKIKRLLNRFKDLWKRLRGELARPIVTRPTESIVEPPRPITEDSSDPIPMPKPTVETVEDIYAKNPGLRGWLGSDAVKPVDYGPGAGQTIDRREVRFLSGSQGNMGIAEGPAGSQHYFSFKAPVGTKVEVITGMTQSPLGACDTVSVSGYGQYSRGTFDAKTLTVFDATGDTQAVLVELGKAGAVTVQAT